jgi:Flp pilus assembly protein TadD
MGKVEEAIAYYREALIRMSDDPVLHNNIAVALGSAGKEGEAVAHLRRALELKADYGDARKNLDIMTKTIPSSALRPGRRADREASGR